MVDSNNYQPSYGGVLKEDGTKVNVGDMLQDVLDTLGNTGGVGVGNETVSVPVNAIAQLAHIPSNATKAVISVESGDIRYWRKTPPLPTSTSGHLGKAGSEFQLTSAAQLADFRAFGLSGSPTLQISYLGPTEKPDPIDTQPPTAPTGLSATEVTASQVKLSWTASSDNVGVVGYDVYRNGVKISNSATTTYTDNTVSPATSYTYTVKARDAAGNVSATSEQVTAKTLPSQTTEYGAISDPQGRSFVADKGYVSNSLSDPTSGIWLTSATFRSKHTAMKNFNKMQFVYSASSGESALPNTMTLKLAIEVEDPTTKALTRYPITWDAGGTRSLTFQPGEIKYTHPLELEFVKGQNFWIRSFISVPTDGKYPKTAVALHNLLQEGKVVGEDRCDFDQSVNPVLTGSSDVAGSFMPLAIIGVEKSGERTPSVLLWGDSINSGSADDQAAGKLPNQRGFGARACYEAGLPFANISIGGERVADFQQFNTIRLNIAKFATHAIGNYGTNDNGSSLATMKTNLSNAFTAVKAANPKIMVYQMKILPRNVTNINTIYSTWYAPGNVRDQVNDWISTLPYADGLIDGYFDGAYPTEKQNPRNGGFRSTAYTTDMTHPIPYGHEIIRKAVDMERILAFQPFRKVEDRIPAKPTGFKAAVGETNAFLTWDESPDFFVSGFNVYRNGTKVTATPIDYKTPLFYDSGLTSGISYTYTVRAVSLFDVESQDSAAVTKTAAPLPLLVSDTFNRPSSTSLGDAETGVEGSKAWERNSTDRYDIYNPSGTDGQLRRVGTAGANQFAYIETGVDDYALTVTHTALANNGGPTLCLRLKDAQNMVSVNFSLRAGVSTRINNQFTANIFESPTITPASTAGETRKYTVVMQGSAVFLLINDVLVHAAYDKRVSFAGHGTKAGFSASTVNDAIDNFSVRKI
ncbi:hypothetical protein SAMN02799630_02809 [Paenibacillus sp. UNCCL117]|nr:hypothetical protein SAMN04488602_107103 [Paenibacillus sp. cl123]SFW40697.1 hypothetical protein SAMN02799630_02809 [Paenibacillus sp. UNCCL117]